jgi:SAM-dependent methyltransferase
MSASDTPAFKDHFSGHAFDYARYRPGYPAALYDWLASQAPGQTRAWDVATGNGQAALALARHFHQVIATDASEQQLAQAVLGDTIEYRVEAAEASSLDDCSADLVTVAQAYHWFDHERFLQEVERVARPGAVLAIWTYALAEINPALDVEVRQFYQQPIEKYWPPERRLVEEAYASLKFPWEELPVPEFRLELDWSLADFLGYLRTWSAVRRYASDTGVDPVFEWESRFKAAWGDTKIQPVSWPMRVRAFRLPAQSASKG